jgi:hypothetical protein
MLTFRNYLEEGVSIVIDFFDALCIAPYRLVGDPVIGFYLGTLVLALACLFCGKISQDMVWLWNRRHYEREEGEMIRMHNLSVTAIEAGDKAAYKAANREANEAFGKSFFAGAALFSVSVWPVPFALGWLDGRFSGVDVPLLPGHTVRYNAVFLGFYILARLAMWPLWRRLPLLGRVERRRLEAGARMAKLRRWSDLGKGGA